jgi:serine protease Do
MRRIDWILMVAVFAISIGLRMFTSDSPPSDNAPYENPRRPSPEKFTPKRETAGLWARETESWPTIRPRRGRNEIPASAGLPREGTIQEDGKTGASSGTAFSVSGDGYWLTARHVVEGCAKTGIQTRQRGVVRVQRVILHPRADVAMLVTKGAPNPLPVADVAGGRLRTRDAFNIGFPAGQPGAVHARYMGQMTLRHSGRRLRGGGYRERVNAWSEQSRAPERSGSLGGLSGGAVLDGAGRVIGVVQAESRRRGRVMTATPNTLRELFELAKFTPPLNAVESAGLAVNTYPAAARYLILSRRVAKVICRT